MPLPDPDYPRKRFHTRTVTCQGFQRDDGLWDIDGWMTDVKDYGFANKDRGGWVEAGEPLHGMGLRLTVDDELNVVAVVAMSEYGPYTVCPQITSAYQQLAGLRIGPGWNARVRRMFAGVGGCTHLTELLGPMATTAVQTVFSSTRRDAGGEGTADDGRRPRFLDTCHAMASDGPVVLREYPRHYTGPDRGDG